MDGNKYVDTTQPHHAAKAGHHRTHSIAHTTKALHSRSAMHKTADHMGGESSSEDEDDDHGHSHTTAHHMGGESGSEDDEGSHKDNKK